MSVRITAAGAVAVVVLAFLTAPVSACDERYIKKCERASAAAAAAAEAQTTAPVAKRRSAGRVHVIVSRRSKHTRFTKRTRAPGFTIKRAAGVTLASGSSRMTALVPESALARRFRGFIDPRPLAQNAFEALRKPHLVAINLEPPVAPAPVEPVVAAPPVMAAAAAAPAAAAASPAAAPAAAAPTAAPAAPVVSVSTTAKQDRMAPKPPAMELASAQSQPVTLSEPPPPAKPLAFAAANAAPAPAQAFLSETPPSGPAGPQPSRFSIHQLMLALCGALGAASALRFIVGA